ncbi:MAG TPA: glycosyltransferase [Pyrinomonadaceae bacterium]|nr:glycosyltransferase [Pyrinomonadaceae bacterium]
MRVALFYQSLISDWNHGNAHFLRGVVSELLARGHKVDVYEPRNSWSVQNLIAEHGWTPVVEFEQAYPQFDSIRYDLDHLDLDEALRDADLAIVHEWNEPQLIERIGEYRRRHGNFVLLFHDTHHRIAGHESLPFSLQYYDGVLAYGQVLTDRYLSNGWSERAWTWHEAADVRVFHPLPNISRTIDLVWIGNWGDDERTSELHEFLIEPVRDLRLHAEVYGVRYPDEAVAALTQAGIRYRGWLPNYRVPEVFAASRVTLHIPRRPYVRELVGIPTIRPFEALACGVPLICSPWSDAEHLFTPGRDYLVARSGDEMKQLIRKVLTHSSFAKDLAAHGLATIKARHTCAHRVDELMTIYAELAKESRQLVAAL